MVMQRCHNTLLGLNEFGTTLPKFCRFLWDQGFEYVTGIGSWKKTFGAPESLVGFCGTRGSNI